MTDKLVNVCKKYSGQPLRVIWQAVKEEGFEMTCTGVKFFLRRNNILYLK